MEVIFNFITLLVCCREEG